MSLGVMSLNNNGAPPSGMGFGGCLWVPGVGLREKVERSARFRRAGCCGNLAGRR